MLHDSPSLTWKRFSIQFGAAAGAFAAGVLGGRLLIESSSENMGFAIGTNLVLIPLAIAFLTTRVAYRTDEFERRLRNWSMTQSAVWIFMFSAIIAILGQRLFPEAPAYIPYVAPAAFLMVHALYTQYLRFCIISGKKNAFSDGSSCS